jgi:hypothetical protein
MAIAAIDAQSGDMMLVTERHRLRDRRINLRGEVGTGEREDGEGEGGEGGNPAENDQSRYCIRALFEKLSHATTIPLISSVGHRFIPPRANIPATGKPLRAAPPQGIQLVGTIG